MQMPFTPLVFSMVANWTRFLFQKSLLVFFLKKRCMPKTKSTSDLEATYSYAKNMKGAN
jgi:hypothetical protein